MTSVTAEAQAVLDATGSVEGAIDEANRLIERTFDGDNAHWLSVRRYLEDNGSQMPVNVELEEEAVGPAQLPARPVVNNELPKPESKDAPKVDPPKAERSKE